jgi:hypothetical protein
MMRRSVPALFLLLIASTASAAWYPALDGNIARIQVGETVTVRVRAIWTGLMIVPWTPWIFESSNPSVIRVDGAMYSSTPGEMRITGISPGHGLALIRPMSSFYNVDVTVVCGQESAVQAAEVRQTVKTGEPVALRALTSIADRTTFTWYHGHIGDTSFPIGQSGPEVVYITDDPGLHSAWVLATTSCSSSMAEFQIDAVAPKRRGVRH